MIEKIVSTIIYPELEDMTWVGQVGYMAIRQNRRQQAGDGSFVDYFYPAAPNVKVEDCQKPDYHILVPDQNLRSLVIIEQIGGINYARMDNISMRQGQSFTAQIAIKGWINYVMLAADPRHEYWFINEINTLFNGYRAKNVNLNLISGDVVDPNHTIILSKVRMRYVGRMEQTPQAVFGQYNFANDQALFTHDYGYFGIIYEISGIEVSGCAPTVEWQNDGTC